MGRKKSNSLYDVTPTLLLRIEALAADGLQNNQIAASLGWSEATYYKKKSETPEFAEAIKRGETSSVQDVVNALKRNALGYLTEEVTEEITAGKPAKKKTVKKYRHPNTTAQIFYLVNRDPTNWKHRAEQIAADTPESTAKKITEWDAHVVAGVLDALEDDGSGTTDC